MTKRHYAEEGVQEALRRDPGPWSGQICEKMREIYKETGWSLPYETVGVLGAGATAGTLAMAAVADVRPETSPVTLLCTHRLCHCERGKKGRGLWRSDAHEERQYRPRPHGSSLQQYGRLALQRSWVEGQRWTWRTVSAPTKASGGLKWKSLILKCLHLLSTREQLNTERPGNIHLKPYVTFTQIKQTFKRTWMFQESVLQFHARFSSFTSL